MIEAARSVSTHVAEPPPSDETEPEPAEDEEDEGPSPPGSLRAHVRRLRDLQLPDKLLRRAIAALLDHTLCADIEPATATPVTAVTSVTVDSGPDPDEGPAPGMSTRNPYVLYITSLLRFTSMCFIPDPPFHLVFHGF